MMKIITKVWKRASLFTAMQNLRGWLSRSMQYHTCMRSGYSRESTSPKLDSALRCATLPSVGTQIPSLAFGLDVAPPLSCAAPPEHE